MTKNYVDQKEVSLSAATIWKEMGQSFRNY
jgi:hypothetical protein